ncbi:hypothetical protein HBB16_05745 [Pseudonocardia sp. MCCB 268]|nr:hypothetical protein [Pseudonocardia cytotoxica]
MIRQLNNPRIRGGCRGSTARTRAGVLRRGDRVPRGPGHPGGAGRRKSARGVRRADLVGAAIEEALGAVLPASPTLRYGVRHGVKVLSATVWLIDAGMTPTMGVAWHRFTAFPNIYFKPGDDGYKALGALKPMMKIGGKPLDFGRPTRTPTCSVPKPGGGLHLEGLLDFYLPKCGRCQSAVPAWNTEAALAEAAGQRAARPPTTRPYLLAGGSTDMAGGEGSPPATTRRPGWPRSRSRHARRPSGPLVGGQDVLWMIDPDVLWSCMCGACVEAVPGRHRKRRPTSWTCAATGS